MTNKKLTDTSHSAAVLQIQQDYMDGYDVTAALHLSPRTLKKWRDSGILPYHKIGQKIFYLKTDLTETIHKFRMRGREFEAEKKE